MKISWPFCLRNYSLVWMAYIWMKMGYDGCYCWLLNSSNTFSASYTYLPIELTLRRFVARRGIPCLLWLWLLTSSACLQSACATCEVVISSGRDQPREPSINELRQYTCKMRWHCSSIVGTQTLHLVCGMRRMMLLSKTTSILSLPARTGRASKPSLL